MAEAVREGGGAKASGRKKGIKVCLTESIDLKRHRNTFRKVVNIAHCCSSIKANNKYQYIKRMP
jgi:hypothetical protein